ncbi:hypothetical protein AVEN_257570-1 [Araneus ventricosus]|uniref:Uncharacterized protein n=1 Tax=Araneus ventricosus TaxID=182803 RepID=A0A4Y2L557_ARAVE|nr:hypothetical protein AVEN_257570-1 [Araneus ventricosus]
MCQLIWRPNNALKRLGCIAKWVAKVAAHSKVLIDLDESKVQTRFQAKNCFYSADYEQENLTVSVSFQFFALAALLAVALAEEMETAESYPVATYHQGPALAASSAGHAYGAHGAHSQGYGAYGASNYGDHGRYADRAHAAHGHHNIGGHRAYDAHGAQGSNYGKYRNVGAYAQDKVRLRAR